MIFFAGNSASLNAGARARLADILPIFTSDCGSDGTIYVEGHTDGSGTSRSNLILSRRRAGAVRAYLVGHGIPAGRVETRAAGESRPLHEDPSDGPASENRRVEIVIGPGWTSHR